jgi:hypothetical protein
MEKRISQWRGFYNVCRVGALWAELKEDNTEEVRKLQDAALRLTNRPNTRVKDYPCNVWGWVCP